jgi:hypothetical protein
MTAAPSAEYALTLAENEWERLLRVLEQTLADVRLERRRTESFGYHEQVCREESLLRGLLEKLRRLGR